MGQPQGFPLPHLRAWRLRRLMTATELAAKANISLNTLSRVESEKTRQKASLRAVARLADALGVTREQLLYEDPDSPKGEDVTAA